MSSATQTKSPGVSATGRCFDIQRYSIHNGPGIRTTVFFQGCPLSCPWCHNPESWSRGPELRFLANRCIHCGDCLKACPMSPETWAPGPFDPLRCTRCGSCADACPSGARSMSGREWTASALLNEVERDSPFFEESGGGVTFSGGEPLFQAAFLLECLRLARIRGIHTAVDTCGFAPREVILEVADRTDLFLYDLKILDPARHLGYTGVPVEPILGNLRALDGRGARIWLRVPFVPGFNDDPASMEAIGAFAAGLKHTRRVHILPYHGMGSAKLAQMGLQSPREEIGPPKAGMLEEAVGCLKSHGLDVHLGG